MKLNKSEEKFVDDIIDEVDCSNCPCQDGCNVCSNADCIIRIGDWLRYKQGLKM